MYQKKWRQTNFIYARILLRTKNWNKIHVACNYGRCVYRILGFIGLYYRIFHGEKRISLIIWKKSLKRNSCIYLHCRHENENPGHSSFIFLSSFNSIDKPNWNSVRAFRNLFENNQTHSHIFLFISMYNE